MEVKFETIYERDVDLLLMNKFVYDDNFKYLFLEKKKYKDYVVDSVIHSLSDVDGENDVTVILKKDNKKIGLFIEDKINAQLMSNQLERYDVRKNKYIKDKKLDDCFVFIVAPESYIKSLDNPSGYRIITYEDIIKKGKCNSYEKRLLKDAINKKQKGYDPIEDKNITMFWDYFYDLIESEYSDLINNINILRGKKRGSKAAWPIFNLHIKGVSIVYKSDRGFVDLELPSMSEYLYKVNEYLNQCIINWDSNELVTTSKSLSIRRYVKNVDFSQPFDEQIKDVREALERVRELKEYSKKINVDELMSLCEK